MSGLRAFGGVALLAAAACSGINAESYSFATLDEAVAAGAVREGWLPAGLPPGTREIRTAYVPDTTQHWGLFDFPASQSGDLKRLLAAEEVALDGLRAGVPGRLEWWPVALRGRLNGERLAMTGLKAYRTADGARIVAVNWQQGRAYYWHAW